MMGQQFDLAESLILLVPEHRLHGLQTKQSRCCVYELCVVAAVALLYGPSHLQLSANLQRSLSQVVVDTAREQARSAVTATVHSVTPAVSSAVATALQQELAAAAGAWGCRCMSLGLR